MVEQAECWANPSYLIDIITLISNPTKIKTSEIERLYFDERLSMREIADRVEVSKSFVIRHLSQSKRRDRRTGREHQNYKHSKIPYGFRRAGERIVPDKKEMKVIKLILTARGQGYTYQAIADRLNKSNCLMRANKQWPSGMVYWIVKKWEG
jgi:IS30 family transposase